MTRTFERTTSDVRKLITELGGSVEHLDPKGWSVTFPEGTRTLNTFNANPPHSNSIALMQWELPNGIRVHYDAGTSDDGRVLARNR